MADILIEKAHLLGIDDTQWMGYIEQEGELSYASRSKESRQAAARESRVRQKPTMDRHVDSLSDTEYLYLSIFG